MVQNSKERALTPREFELLLEGARRIEKLRQRREAVLAILLTGRLGFRAGELIHLREEWVDWRQQRIEIPRQTDCHLGEGDDCCGYCRQAAVQMVKHYEPDEGEDSMARTRERMLNRHLEDGFRAGDRLSVDEAKTVRWFAKTDAAAREVPYGWDPRVELAIERFFDKGRAGWMLSKTALNRRLNKALKNAEELTIRSTMPHGLRATAASYHAGRGVPALALQSLLGWADMQTARRYIRQSPDNTERVLHHQHSI